MKIVINGCYGGFSLSHAAVLRYAELKGIKLYSFVNVSGSFSETVPYDDSQKAPLGMIHYYTTPEEEEGSYFSDRSIPRDDPALVQVVEELKEVANGNCAELHVVEIPDGAKWQVEEYDGLEHVAEVHKTWF